MAEGEINVNVKSEGTQDTLDSIAEESAEADGGDGGGMAMAGSGGGGKGGKGGIAGMLGGILGKLTVILGAAMFLASLKPIKELLSGLQRMFSVAILPLVALLSAFLKPLMQKLLKFIGNLDWDNLAKDLTSKLNKLFQGFVEDIIMALPFTGEKETKSTMDALFGSDEHRSIFAGVGGTMSPEELNKPSFFEHQVLGFGNPNKDNFLGLGDQYSEQSRTTTDSQTSDTVNAYTQESGAGGVRE